MSRLSFRPRPLDIQKKLPVLKSTKDLEDDDTPTSTTRNSHLLRFAATETDETHRIHIKKLASEIFTPESGVVDSYEVDYTRTFSQPTSYVRASGARTELGDFVEYDLDNEDDDWLNEFNRARNILSSEKFESILFKLEVLDHKARQRAGVITASLGTPISPLLQFDAAIEALQHLSIKYGVFKAIYGYWKDKRKGWQKPILRRVQPPTPANDTNPFNVFRPREKSHRLHTRRMQRRENNVQSFEKIRQVRRSLEQAKSIVGALTKREEKKRDLMENEVSLQRLQMKYKYDTELLEECSRIPGFTQPTSPKYVSSEDEFVDSDDQAENLKRTRVAVPHNRPFRESNLGINPAGSHRQEFRRRQGPNGWLDKLDPDEPTMLFTKPLVPAKLAAAGIIPPSDSSIKNAASGTPYRFHGRIGRGGRIIFDRTTNPFMPMDIDSNFFVPPQPGSTT